MEVRRTMANIGRTTNVPEQNIHHFMSNSPWSGSGLVAAVQDAVKQHTEFQAGAILVLDESADEKSGAHSAGAGRQHNGRLGKIEMSQVGVFLSLATPRAHTWIDGALYLPQHWFEAPYAERRTKVGIPGDRIFKTKPELGWEMIERAVSNGIAFAAVVMDDLYGRNTVLREQLATAGIEYYGDVPSDTIVYLSEPRVTYPVTKRGKPAKHPVIVGADRYQVRQLLQRADSLKWETITLRPNERGMLTADFARCRVWTVHGTVCRQEWLLLRRDKQRITYVLSNAPEDISLATMAWRKTHRYFIERDNQDAKSELGWDELQAIRYRAWEHQLALTILASWFIAETRLDWMRRFEQDPALLEQYETDVLPSLSVGNVRALLRAAMPLPQLSTEGAVALVIDHLVNRTRSRKSRMRRLRDPTPEM
jgi:SRSO17 transposase